MPEHNPPCECPNACPHGNPLYFRFNVNKIRNVDCTECTGLNTGPEGYYVTSRGQGCVYFCTAPTVCGNSYGWYLRLSNQSALLELQRDGTTVANWSGPTFCDCLSSNNTDPDTPGEFKLELSWIDPDFLQDPNHCDISGQDFITIEIVDPAPDDIPREAAAPCWNIEPCMESPIGGPAVNPHGPGNYDGNCTSCGCGSKTSSVADLSLQGAATGGAGQCSQICFNPKLGNLSIEFTTPGTGADGANPSITYNSSSYYPGGSEAGAGTSAFWTQKAVPVDPSSSAHIDVHGCDGSVRRYACKDENGDYISMGANPNKLRQSTNGYIETEPSGREFCYEGAGFLLSHIANPDGNRWTIIRDFSNGSTGGGGSTTGGSTGGGGSPGSGGGLPGGPGGPYGPSGPGSSGGPGGGGTGSGSNSSGVNLHNCLRIGRPNHPRLNQLCLTGSKRNCS